MARKQNKKLCANCVKLHGFTHRGIALTKNKLINDPISSEELYYIFKYMQQKIHKNNVSVFLNFIL